jgi:putative ABC transport system permease protein
MLGDFRYAARTLLRSPGFAVTAIAALAMGIGASSAIFSVVNKVLLEPLPFPDPDRLVQLMSASQLGNQNVVSIPKYVIWSENTHVFDSIAAYDISGLSVNLNQGDLDDPLEAARVSADYFSMFGAHAAAGRTFSINEDRPDGPRVAVISERLWRGRFGSDPKLVGRTVLLEHNSYKVIGVLARGVSSPGVTGSAADIWLPLQADPSSTDHVSRVNVVARLKPGVSVEEAQTDVGDTMGPFLARYPPYTASEAPMLPLEGFTAISLRDAVVGDVRPALFLLIGAVGFVLLISCANVANLLLARATRRTREIAIRAALGARRDQIIRQLLCESVLLSLAGGALGVALGHLGVRALLMISPSDIPRIGANGSGITLDWRVFLFTLLVSVLTGILFGLMPALSASRTDVVALVKETGSQSGAGVGGKRTQSALVIAEVALALVLLVGAGLLIRTFVVMRTINRGFDEQSVLTLEMSLAGSQFEKTVQVAELVRRAGPRIEHIPGVSAVAATSALPLAPSVTMPFTIFKNDQMLGRYDGAATWRSVSPEYFDAFRIRLLRGRLFNDDDDEQSPEVVLINRAMLKKYWQAIDANPIGDFMIIGKGMGRGIEDAPRQIVGVVADVRDSGLDREPMMYVPIAQVKDSLNARNNHLAPITWVVRINAGPSQISSGTGLAIAPGVESAPTAAIEHQLRQVSGGVPLGRVRTMHQVVAASSARTQFYTAMLSVFAVIALLLAAVGLYGLLAYSVEQRTQEIGIRMALGAGPGDVRSMVVSQGMRLVFAGTLLGIPAALALARITVSMIFGIQTWDPLVLAGVAGLLSLVALCATYLPTLRATRVNPADALRN